MNTFFYSTGHTSLRTGLLFLLCGILYCSQIPTARAAEEPEDILALLKQKTIVVHSVTADGKLQQAHAQSAQGHETFAVRLTNTSPRKLTINLPCGLVFTAQQKHSQAMMAVQAVSVVLAPTTSTTIPVSVVCIDSVSDAPEPGEIYTIGFMQTGLLRKLADCLCQQPDMVHDPMGVQFAFWKLSESQTAPGSMTKEKLEQMSALIKRSGNNTLPPQLRNTLTYFRHAEDWLKQCHLVEPKKNQGERP